MGHLFIHKHFIDATLVAHARKKPGPSHNTVSAVRQEEVRCSFIAWKDGRRVSKLDGSRNPAASSDSVISRMRKHHASDPL